MNESTPFLQSWIFDLILLFGGAMFGFFVAAFCAVSGQASRDEEWRELLAKSEKEKDNAFMTDVVKSGLKILSITKGMPDRE